MTDDLFKKTLFTTIYLDPPWLEVGAGKSKRGADRHYHVMKTDDIIKTIAGCGYWPAIDAHLYMWVTNNFLEDGLKVMAAMGFRYITNIVWVKDKFGLGRYFRGQHELLLFGRRGAYIETKTNNTSTVVHAPRRKHSQKPDEFYELIERNSTGPYLELFARNTRPGWTSWGNEV